MLEDIFYLSIIGLLVYYIIRRRKAKKSKEDNFIPGSTIKIVVNKTLKMKTGKIISQIGHALFYIMRSLFTNNELYKEFINGSAKIEFYEGTAEDIKDCITLTKKKNIAYNKIYDAGRTQIPSGSNSVLVVGPVKPKEIDSFFVKLRRIGS